MKKTVAIIAVGLMSTVGFADITWSGAGGNWNTAGSWSGGSIPTASDDAVINSSGTVSVPNGYTANASNVTVTAGTLQAANTGYLVVHGNLTQNGGTVETRTSTGTITIHGDYLLNSGMMRLIQADKNGIIVNGNFTMGSTAQIDFNMNGAAAISRLAVGGVSTFDGMLQLRNFATSNYTDTILLMQNTSTDVVIGDFSSARLTYEVVVGTVTNVYTLNVSSGVGAIFDLDADAKGATGQFILKLIDFDGDGVANDLVFQAIPEAGTIGLFMISAFVIMGIRRAVK